MRFDDRYAGAVRSSNLKSGDDRRHADPVSNITDTDVLGAAGLAGKRNALALALARLFTGDNRATFDVSRTLSEMAWGKARVQGLKLRRVEADDMARAVLSWHRDGVCRKCGGHGFQIIAGTPTIGESACTSCRGTRKIPFDRNFALERLDLARWLLGEVEKEQAKAGPAAMAALAPKLDL